MFQNFANYLLGSVLNQNQEASGEATNPSNIRIRSSEENDWVLVDRDSEGNSDASSISSLEDDAERNEPFHRVTLTRSSSTSSLPCPSNMDESWFVTPPPCFTSTGPIQMRTSPLENLLIEHPSMSVYHFHPSRRHFPVAMTATRSASANSRGSIEDAEVVEVVDVVENVRQELVVDNRRPRLTCLPVLQQGQQYLKSKRAQKIQIQKSGKSMNRGNLERINKAREVNSRNQRQRRGERSQGATRSHANNNRKC